MKIIFEGRKLNCPVCGGEMGLNELAINFADANKVPGLDNTWYGATKQLCIKCQCFTVSRGETIIKTKKKKKENKDAKKA
jgi:hypothetical protein